MAAARPAIALTGRPGQTAVIVRTRLPSGLERLRRRCVDDATRGVPAHLTLLYPFVEPGELDRSLRSTIADVAARHQPFAYRLTERARWPDTVYAVVEPVEPFLAIHRDLAAAFPDYPIYGRPAGFELVPHVTLAEGDCIDDPAVDADPSWAALSVTRSAESIEVIAEDVSGHWRLVWRIRLGGSGGRYNPGR